MLFLQQVQLYFNNSFVYNVSLCSQSIYYNKFDSSLLSTVHRAIIQILLTIVNFKFHHAATYNPGHGTKFVTLPSPVFYVSSTKVGFYIFEYVYWKSLLVVVSTSPVVWSQVRWFFLMRIVFCAINHDEIT